jgi:hypothetical protein
MSQQPLKNQEKGRVLPFRLRAPGSWNGKLRPREQARSPIPDLSKYSCSPEEDDYGHRMRMNLLALLVLSLIVCCGIWIVDNMSERTEVRDCVSVGRNNCEPIPVPPGASTR